MPPNHWIVICPEPKAPGVWLTWYRENCVALGWPPPYHQLKGPTDSAGWDTARGWAQQIQKGDIVVPYLLRFRFGPPGEVTRVAVADSEWRPTVPSGYSENPEEPELGRRIEVKWIHDNAPPPSKIAIVPERFRKGPETRHTLEPMKTERYSRVIQIISDPPNWSDYQVSETEPLQGETEDELIPSTESPPDKLKFQEDLVRKILARNLERIETGLRPHPDFRRLEEVSFELGRLDLICQDAQGKLVIVELQLGWLDYKHIGQTCLYYGWFKQKCGPELRAILLCEKATPEHLEAYKRALPWVELKKFELQADIAVRPL